MNLMSRDFRGITGPLPHYSTVPLTTVPLLLGRCSFFELQNCLLAQIDQKLPFTRHVICTLQDIYFVKHTVVVMLVGAQKVVVGNP